MKTAVYTLNYKKGATFSGVPFWIGLAIIGISLYGFISTKELLLKILFSFLFIIGVIPTLSLKGVRVIASNAYLEEYLNLIAFKITLRTLDATHYDSLELRLFSDIESFQKIPQSTTVRTKVYELYLKNAESTELFLETTNYLVAKKMLYDIAQQLNLKPVNAYQKWKTEIIKKRKR